MQLPVPKLNVRTWADLVAEGRVLIPRSARGWTDHNAHDPGITLMELFAWLTEMLLYRLDRVPPAMERSFLRLVGVRPRDAGVAETVVVLRSSGTAAPAQAVPADVRITNVTGTSVYQATHGLSLSPAWIDLTPSAAPRAQIRTVSASGASVDHTSMNGPHADGFAPFGDRPSPGDTLLISFDQLPAADDAELSCYLWTPSWLTDGETRRRIASEGRSTVLHPGASVVWEYRTASGTWAGLRVIADETRALTLAGRVALAGPARAPAASAWAAIDGRYELRCRFAGGSYDCPPRLQAIAINALPIRHAAAVGTTELLGNSVLGASDGRAGQTYRLDQAPVVAGSTRLRVTERGVADDGWREVPTWDETAAGDRHYVLDPVTGTIAFGDGRFGRVPADGAAIEALGYAVGSGSAGNLPPRTLDRISPVFGEVAEIVQPFAAAGGAPPESLDHAHGRALAALAAPARALTTEDFERLARETPGVRVARARAWPRFHPAYRCFVAEGVVTVVVLPPCGTPPMPTDASLRAIHTYLERRRTLGTEVHVVGPSYVHVTVSADVFVKRGVDAPETATRARDALDRFFDPLRGGPDSTGWPFGRDVLSTEVLAVLGSVQGVEHVDSVRLSSDTSEPRCTELPLCPTELVASGRHRIAVKEEAA